MTTTRKELIIKHYNEMMDDVKKQLDVSLFPSIDDMDVTDLLFYFNMYFGNVSTDLEYINIIRDLGKIKGVDISMACMSLIFKPIKKFIVFFKTLT